MMQERFRAKSRFLVFAFLVMCLAAGFFMVAHSEEAYASDTIKVVFHGDKTKTVSVSVDGKLKSSQFPKNPKAVKLKDSRCVKAYKTKFVGWTADSSKCFTTKKIQKKAKITKKIGQTANASSAVFARVRKIFEPHNLVKTSTVFHKYADNLNNLGVTSKNGEITKVDLYPVYVIQDKVAGVRFTIGGIFTDVILPYKSTLSKYDSFCEKKMRNVMQSAGGYSKSYAKKAKFKGYYKKMNWNNKTNVVRFSQSFSPKKKITAECTELYAHWNDSSGLVVV